MKKIIISILLLIFIAEASEEKSLYQRLGGYDSVAAVSKDFHVRLKNDHQLGRFWAYRGTDGLERELQLLIDFVCFSTDGPIMYTGRDMPTTHIGMKISESDWKVFMVLLQETLDKFKLHQAEQNDVITFMESLKSSMVEVK